MNKYKNIPQELKDLPNWICYRKEERKGRSVKIPYSPETGKPASHSKPETWTSFSKALAAAKKYDGLGFNFSKSPYTGIDIDHCLEDGTLSELAASIVKHFNSYTEISPSGTGLHIIVKGALPCGIDGKRNSELEIYSEKRYFTITGNIFSGQNTIRRDTGELNSFFQANFSEKNALPQVGGCVSLLEDKEVLKKAKNAANAEKFNSLFSGQWDDFYGSQSEADQALCNILAFWSRKDFAQIDRLFRQSDLMRNKWDEKHSSSQKTYGEMTIERAIRDCLIIYEPDRKEFRPNITVKSGNYSFTDKGNAERFLDNFRNEVRYLTTGRAWYIWDGRRWAEDITGKIYIYVRALIDSMEDEAREMAAEIKAIEAHQEEADPEELARRKRVLKSYRNHILKTASAAKMQAVVMVARTFQGVPILPNDLNKDTNLLNVGNGIINLRTGKLLPHDKEKLISRLVDIDYSPNTEYPPLWLKFLSEVTCGDKELELYIQKALGYSLTGDVSEQCFFICHGGGSNGKSTLLDVVSAVLGDYAGTMQIDSLMAKKERSGTSDLARLSGIRFLNTSEPTQGMRLDEGLIKQMTGGDKVVAAYKFRDEFEFYPIFKLWISTNHDIIIRGTDTGIWRRVRVIPFGADFSTGVIDKHLKEKLLKEKSGILKWLIDGCLLWRKEGLENPPAVAKATSEYQSEMNVVSRFLSECVEKRPAEPIKASVVYEIFFKWCRSSGEYCPSQRQFGLELGKLGFEKRRIKSGYIYENIALTERCEEFSFL